MDNHARRLKPEKKKKNIKNRIFVYISQSF